MIKKKWDMFAESVSMSLSNIAGNKMRTFLTTLGIIIGVGAIIALMTVVQGATDTMYAFSDGQARECVERFDLRQRQQRRVFPP